MSKLLVTIVLVFLIVMILYMVVTRADKMFYEKRVNKNADGSYDEREIFKTKNENE